jgi:septum formation inhibitor MinC
MCNNYSGGANAQYEITEKLIDKYIKEGKITVRELTISLVNFENFTNEHLLTFDQKKVIDQNKNMEKILKDARSYVLELFTYFVFNNDDYYRENFKIELNSDKNNKKGEKDILLTSKKTDEIILVECKLDPNNQNFEELLQILEDKINKPEHKAKIKSIQLWFWYEPNKWKLADIEKYKRETEIIIVCVSKKDHKLLKNIDQTSLKNALKDYSDEVFEDVDD